MWKVKCLGGYGIDFGYFLFPESLTTFDVCHFEQAFIVEFIFVNFYVTIVQKRKFVKNLQFMWTKMGIKFHLWSTPISWAINQSITDDNLWPSGLWMRGTL